MIESTTNSISEYANLVSQAIDSVDGPSLGRLQQELQACRDRRSTVYLFGNGGSAATASHFACDLAKTAQRADTNYLRVIALTDNIPIMTAWANDSSYDAIFAEQLKNLMVEGDIVIAISCSGNSPNVLAGVRAAKGASVLTVGFTTQGDSKLVNLVDVAIQVNAPVIQVAEDAHMAIGHFLSLTV